MFNNAQGSHFANVEPNLDAKLLRNKFQKQLTVVVSDLGRKVESETISFSCF
jgi:hypothetical protein